MRHSDAILNMALKVFILSFHSMPLNVIILSSLSASSTSFYTLSLGSLNRIFWITHFQSIYNGSVSLPDFRNTSLVSSMFFLCAKWNTFFVRISLPIYHSFMVCAPFFWRFSPFSFLTKIPKIFFPLSVKEKNTMKQQK